MSEEEKSVALPKVSVSMNGWTVATILIFAMIGFVLFGTPDQHEMFLGGVERIVGALKDLLQ